MTQISFAVGQYLDTHPTITSSLLQDLMSLRALARHLCKELALGEKHLHAVMSAIRRYKREHKRAKTGSREIFAHLAVKTRDNLADVHVKKSRSVQDTIAKLATHVAYERGDVLRVIQAEQSVRIIIDEHHLKECKKLFRSDEIYAVTEHLAEINLRFAIEAEHTSGIFALVTAALSAGNINIVEMMSCAPELIVLVDEKDLTIALTIIGNLKPEGKP